MDPALSSFLELIPLPRSRQEHSSSLRKLVNKLRYISIKYGDLESRLRRK